MGYQVSEKGREGLGKMVTPSPGGGYDVRLADNGKCKTVHVDKVYSNGVTDRTFGNPKSQGVVTIIESAVSQTDNRKLSCGDYLKNQGHQRISGSKPDMIWKNARNPLDHHLRDRLTNDHEDINKRIEEGSSVVLSSNNNPLGKQDPIRVTQMKNGVPVDGEEATILNNHYYVVTKATAEGVWLRNPHGKANKSDGGYEFFVPRDQIEKSFSSVHISQPISKSPCMQ